MTDAMAVVGADWIDDEDPEAEDFQVEEYELTSSPNDFNITTIFNFIDSGAVKIPGFQRNYVWDIKRASKLIESIIIGLPVPQIFLYEEARNRFLVIDGQQRLMSVYYFVKQRFPRVEKRPELRRIFDQKGTIPDEILHDDKYFVKFSLALPSMIPDKPNKFNGLNYSTLEDYKTSFDLRTIRNVIVKQNVPRDDDSSIYEMFNRLNTGGINLGAQEIRTSLYHSDFYDMLYRINTNPGWRRLVGIPEPDLHMRDIEILLRSFAVLLEGATYNPSMTKFLNRFSKTAKTMKPEKIAFLEKLFDSFIRSSDALTRSSFVGKSGKFSLPVFEAVFAAIGATPLANHNTTIPNISPEAVGKLREDEEFLAVSQQATTNKTNVRARLKRARELLLAGD
jgi:uncharacterized protein with ParB-like and HNH nuclease domain